MSLRCRCDIGDSPTVDQKEVDFIRKWIFPGGFVPTISYVVDCIRVGARNTLVVDSISNIGVSSIPRAPTPSQEKQQLVSYQTLTLDSLSQPHYARTLREWRRRFLANFNNLIQPALRAEHPEMTDVDIEVFKRKWICKSISRPSIQLRERCIVYGG